MNRIAFYGLLFFNLCGCFAQSEILGYWVTVGDNNKEAESIVHIFKQDEKYQGTLVELLKPDDNNKDFVGLWLLRNLEYSKKNWKGKVLDPNTKKLFSCSLVLTHKDTLKLRGYFGYPWIGRTQFWHRQQP